MPKFTHLHVHSHYSLLDGLPKINEILDYVKELGMDSVALTDHGNIYGAVEFFKEAKKRGIKPIVGAEMYLAYEDMTKKRPRIDDQRYHLVLLAKSEEGYKNLVKLITRSHLEGFYYKPRIDEKLLAKHSNGLICLSACLAGKIPNLILANKIEEAEKKALRYQEIFGKENFYLELQQHPKSKDQNKVNPIIISIAGKYDIPLVATNDVHYLRSEDAEAQDILMLINTGADPNDPERLSIREDDFSMRSPEQIAKDFKEIPQAIENTQKIAEVCNFEFRLGETKLPYFEVPEGKDTFEYFKELCLTGIKKRYGVLPSKEVQERLNYELSLIKKMGFVSYFLIVQDFVNWAKENRIVVGPGRGSAAGSIVAYALGITNVDPLEYNLLFERFLNPSRISMPDIDLDFTDRRRDEVIKYITQKYGSDKVAQIITFGTMAARAVVRDVGRALGYSYGLCDQVAKLIPFGSSLNESLEKVSEIRQMYDTDPNVKKLIDFAKKLEGRVRHASTHACGIVISKDPLDNVVPLQHPTQDDEAVVTQYEMHSIEDLGLLKMDLLGLKNLTIIEDTLARIYVIKEKKIDIEELPLDDRKTYQLLQRGDTIGVFQLESEGMRRYLKQLQPTKFEDIVVMIALYRPGPMSLIPDYIKRKNKKKRIEYLHPKMKPILENTYGVMIFQEQLMQVAQQLAGLSLAEADTLRKAVGKKIRSLLLAQEEKCIKGMIENGIEKKVAKNIWDWILPFARYGFNRAHSCSYATIAYQTAYLKSHYPIEFMSALLTSEKADTERIGFLIKECKKMRIEVLAPDINESFRNFSVVPREKKIRFGLFAIKNVGENIVEAIISERKENGSFRSIDDFISRIKPNTLNKRSLESLIKAGVLDRFAERNKLLHNLEMLLECSRENHRIKISGQKSLFDGKQIKTKMNLEDAPPATKTEKLSWEKELLGLYVTSHPLEDFKEVFKNRRVIQNSPIFGQTPTRVVPISEINSNFVNRRISIGGIISKIKKIITKNGRPMLFVNLEDLTDKIEVVVFPGVIEQNSSVFQENKIVLVSGRINERDGTPKLICENIEEVIEG